MLKFALVVCSALIATQANATELKLSPAELAAKKLSICRNLQSSIVNVSQLANHHSLEPGAEDASFFTRMQAELLQNFKQLQCESRLDQAAADFAAKVRSCQKLYDDRMNAWDQQLAIDYSKNQNAGLKKSQQLDIKIEQLMKSYEKAGCSALAKHIKARE